MTEGSEVAIPNNSAERGIPKHLYGQLCRELAVNEVKRSALARQYGVVPSTITDFAKRHAARIDEVRKNLDDEFAGMWIAQKARRIDAYAADFEASLAHPRAGHFEQVRVRTQILQAVAEELGQLPPRMQVNVMPVVHVIEGVNLEDLK